MRRASASIARYFSEHRLRTFLILIFVTVGGLTLAIRNWRLNEPPSLPVAERSAQPEGNPPGSVKSLGGGNRGAGPGGDLQPPIRSETTSSMTASRADVADSALMDELKSIAEDGWAAAERRLREIDSTTFVEAGRVLADAIRAIDAVRSSRGRSELADSLRIETLARFHDVVQRCVAENEGLRKAREPEMKCPEPIDK